MDISPLNWHSNPVAIPVSSEISMSSNQTTTVVTTSIEDTFNPGIEVKELAVSIRMACQAFLKPHTESRMLVTTSAFGIHTV